MAPPQGQMRPGRQLAILGAIFVIFAGFAWFGGSGGWQDRLAPKLGLDLVGGTQVVLKAVPANGQPPNATDLEEARQIIEERVNGLGVSEAQVVTEGDSNIVISVAGRAEDAIKDVGQSSQLFFRKVVKSTNGGGVPAAAPSASATPTPTGSVKPSTKPSVTPSAKASGAGGGAAVAPSPSVSAAASKPAPTTSASTGPSATPSPTAAPAAKCKGIPNIDQVKTKVGKPAWDAANALTAPVADGAQLAPLEPFGTLTPCDVAALPVAVQFNVPQIDCLLLDNRPVGSIADPKKQAVACGDGAEKMFLDVSKVAGTDVAKASPQIEQNGAGRVVSLDFTSDGQEKWTALTKEAFNNEGEPKCDASAVGENNRCRVAVAVDNKVISAPVIQGVLTSQSQITGNFDAKEAANLANSLNFGALQISFEPQDAQTITATLGAEQLKAGLLAAGIGMLLVIIYSFFYYRLLGTVIFLSLVLSGALTFLALVLLGRNLGFTLTLAGIAGFIVSLGVAADSFVIYFERLKDEIREGRSARSAVPRAWVRARRTILTANAISLMAAAVLYMFSGGAVRGFAFALGVATLLDLVVVFLFRHPIMTMFSRTDAFLSPRVSGLGRVLSEAKEVKS